MNSFLIIFIQIIVSQAEGLRLSVDNKCQCSDLTNERDCKQNCFWNQQINKCKDRINFPNLQSYCSKIDGDCSLKEGCGYYDGICLPFTGCSAIEQKSNSACLSYSYKCISDGQMCVEKGKCESYKTSYSCQKNYDNYVQKGYCFWDTNVCRSSKECAELPHQLNSDQQCREQLSWCTYQEGGGCISSGIKCVNQVLQKQCVSNKYGTQKCYWNGKKCFDHLCKYIDQDCIKNGCSIDLDGKCIDLQECEEYIYEISCIINKQNEECMWENGKCYKKMCENASLLRKNNQECQKIDKTCITKEGGGCLQNAECDQAENYLSCSTNIRGEQCYWNDYECVQKQCLWAPVEYQSADFCKLFNSNCVYNGKECIEKDCNALNVQEECLQNFQCKWLNKCDIKTCDTANRDLQHINHQDCANYMEGCTLHDRGIGCMNIKYVCNSYNKKAQCYQSRLGLCAWYKNQCLDFKCEYFNFQNHKDCSNVNKTCTSNGTTCIQLQKDCSSYKNSISCNIDLQDHICIWNVGKCQKLECELLPKTLEYHSHQQCNNVMNTCTSKYYQYDCMEIPNDCKLLNEYQCKTAKCIYDQGVCRDIKCNDYRGESSQSHCESYLEGKICMIGNQINGYACVEKPKQCSDIESKFQCFSNRDQKECTWMHSQCIDSNKLCSQDKNGVVLCNQLKKCNDFINNQTKTNQICEDYLISCIRDINDDMKCMNKDETDDKLCRYYVSKQRCKNLNYCYWTQNNLCKNLEENCSKILKQLDCQQNYDKYGRKCIWSNNSCVFECTNLLPQNYKCSFKNSQCVIHDKLLTCINKKNNCKDYLNDLQCLDDSKCIWKSMSCFERQCTDILNQNFDHYECNKYKSTCTVAYLGGCDTLLDECTKYQSQKFCIMKINQQKCYWNVLNQCVDFICENLQFSDCNKYSEILQCQYNLDTNQCEKLKQLCSDYKNENSCVKQLDGFDCIWRNDRCIQLDCELLYFKEYNHQRCFEGIKRKRCTINNNNTGCINLKDSCDQYVMESQCFLTNKNTECFWDTTCKQKSCSDYNELEQCSPYSFSCIQPSYQCRNIVCEDYIFTKDLECKQKDEQCTSDGIRCRARASCLDTLYQEACNIDKDNKLCGWNNGLQLCQYLSCNDAPKDITNCEIYFPLQNCVPLQNGGCVKVLSCYDYTIETYCNESTLFKCIWNDKSCRDQQCDDRYGSTLEQCQQRLSNCTTDGKKCTQLQLCSQYQQVSCILGLDGPCLYVNNQCYQYSNCQSISFETHNKCYDSLFNQCTSNGTNCIPITTCEDYDNQLSCVIDNKKNRCAWVDSKCTILNKCENYKLKSHKECQSISLTCTINDDQNECQDLRSCSEYNLQDNCQYNNRLMIKINFVQIETCYWNDKVCQDVQCEQIKGTTHQQCNEYMKKCTSDGKSCLTIQNCDQYTKDQCDTAFSNNGKCQVTSQGCQNVNCYQLTVESQCKVYSQCQFINQRCQPLLQCDKYSTQEDCTKGVQNSNCIYKIQQCSQIKECMDINQQNKCDGKYCFWNNGQCQDHSCKTYGQLNICNPFYNYNNTILTYCRLDDAKKCIQINNLSKYSQQDCYLKSLEFYQYNQTNNTCQPCRIQKSNTITPKPSNIQDVLNLHLIVMIIIIL